MIFKVHSFIFLLCILLDPYLTYPQFGLRMNGEFGYYKSTGEESFKQDDVLTRVDASARYNYDGDTRHAALQLRARPEFYRFKNSIASVKIKAEGDFSQNEENFIWGADLSRQKNFFNGRGLKIDYDILSASANSEWLIENDNSFHFVLGYAYQNINNEGKYNSDLFFFNLVLLNASDKYFKYGYGIYVERFLINNLFYVTSQLEDSQVELMNNGWRYGPELSLTFLKSLIITADYRFLIHESKFTKNFSYEHWIRFVAGIIFLTDWSVFVLADYYTRKFRLSGDPSDSINPLYTPLNLENRVYLKLSNTLSQRFEIYSKLGYFKDNLYENELSVEGWNLLLGVEFNWE